MGLFQESDRQFHPGADETSLGRMVKVIETGTGLLTTDLIPVYDASLPAAKEVPTPDHVIDLNSYVADKLDPAPTAEMPQAEAQTQGNSLSRVRRAVGAAATAVVTGLGGV